MEGVVSLTKDYELGRLKSLSDDAFNRKNRAWERQNDLWNKLQSLRSKYGPIIERISREHDQTFASMKNCFERASSAFISKDHASASSYSSQGKGYKAHLLELTNERRRLIDELKVAGNNHSRVKEEFRDAKEAHARTSQEFKSRLEQLKADNQHKREDKKDIARRAGVPNQYLDDVWVSKKSNGIIQIYFGGIGKPDGPGHGHYTIAPNGEVTHAREPFEPHGAQNFKHDSLLESRLASIALSVFQRHKDRKSVGPQATQFNDGNVEVRVRSGYNRKQNMVVTDIIVKDRINSPEEHLHLILSEYDGSILHSEWGKNHA